MTPSRALIPHRKSPGQNRLSVHMLAEAAGITYADMKARLFHMAIETPLSVDLTRDMIDRIQRNVEPQIVAWRKDDVPVR